MIYLTCSTDIERELQEIKFLHNATEEKLEKIVADLGKKKSRFELALGMIAIVFVILGIVVKF